MHGLTVPEVEVGVASTYRALARVAVVDGTATVTVIVPSDLPAGTHHVQVRTLDGTLLAQVELVVAAATGGSLASTGAEVGAAAVLAVLLLAGGAVLLAVRRRARSA